MLTQPDGIQERELIEEFYERELKRRELWNVWEKKQFMDKSVLKQLDVNIIG